MAGDRQHHVPAALIGRFSTDATAKRARQRKVWVKGSDSALPIQKRAERVAHRVGLYDTHDGLAADLDVDAAWGYEPLLPRALDALSDRTKPLRASTWVDTLVPFVSGVFCRGPGFVEHFRTRVPGLLDEQQGERRMSFEDSATRARLLDYQMLMAPIMASRWVVAHFSSSAEIVTSDSAFCMFSTPDGDGYAIPVDPRTVLMLLPPSPSEMLTFEGGFVPRTPNLRPALTWTGPGWTANVEHRTLGDSDIAHLNRAMGAWATDEVYGPTPAAVEQGAPMSGQSIAEATSFGSAFADVDLGCHLYDYFRVLSATRAIPPTAQQAADHTDWSKVSPLRWPGPVAVELLRAEQTRGGVSIDSDQLTVDLAYGTAVRFARRRAGDPGYAAMALGGLALVPPQTGWIDGPATLRLQRTGPRVPDAEIPIASTPFEQAAPLGALPPGRRLLEP